MKDYHQPSWYKFGSDSLELVDTVEQFFSSKESFLSCLDIGAGCGVLGFELLLRKRVVKLVSLEKQAAFINFLNKNRELFGLQSDAQVIHHDCLNYKGSQKFDLIISNPPYFESRKFRSSKIFERQVCRFYESETLNSWKVCIMNNLKDKGFVAFCYRESVWIQEFLNGFDVLHTEQKRGCVVTILQHQSRK